MTNEEWLQSKQTKDLLASLKEWKQTEVERVFGKNGGTDVPQSRAIYLTCIALISKISEIDFIVKSEQRRTLPVTNNGSAF